MSDNRLAKSDKVEQGPEKTSATLSNQAADLMMAHKLDKNKKDSTESQAAHLEFPPLDKFSGGGDKAKGKEERQVVKNNGDKSAYADNAKDKKENVDGGIKDKQVKGEEDERLMTKPAQPLYKTEK